MKDEGLNVKMESPGVTAASRCDAFKRLFTQSRCYHVSRLRTYWDMPYVVRRRWGAYYVCSLP